jgi:hypothetical protein
MIGAFPDLYPDEMLVSGWARYEAWVCYPGRRALLEELFGDSKVEIAFDLPGRLGAFTAALPPEHSAASVERLIQEHTLLPYYTASLPAQRRMVANQQMGSKAGGNLHGLLGLRGRGAQLPERLRYCPGCVVEDRERFGETYWHRIHQAAGVEVCPEHTVWLVTTDAPMWMVHGSVTFPAAEAVVAAVPPCLLDLNRLADRQLLRLAQAVRWLLAHPNLDAETLQLKPRALLQLVARGCATYSGHLKQREIEEAVECVFSDDILARIGCALNPLKADNSWVRRILRNCSRTTFVLYSLLLVLLCAEDLSAFLCLPTELKPFGESPWPCLNPTCEHHGERCIPVCEVGYNSQGFPRGTFTCARCGFVYSRVGPDTKPDDLYRVGEVKARGPIWEEKLRQLWLDPNVTIRHMVAVMHSSWGHLRWQGTRLGLPFPPPGVRGRRRTKTPAPLRQQAACVSPTAYRAAWLEVVRQHPDQTVQVLRKQASQTYNWLRYHDREWLLENTPQKKRGQSRVSSVDWEQRDDELVAEIERGYEQLMSHQEVLFRVSATAILTAIRRRGYYTTNRHHLPKTVDVLTRLAESFEDFAIRRVWHIAKGFQADGQVHHRRVLAEHANVDGPPHRNNPRVQAAVDAALAWSNGDLGELYSGYGTAR